MTRKTSSTNTSYHDVVAVHIHRGTEIGEKSPPTVASKIFIECTSGEIHEITLFIRDGKRPVIGDTDLFTASQLAIHLDAADG